MKTLDRVIRLWLEGHTLQQIARLTKMSASTIYEHVQRGTLTLPERDWVRAGDVGVRSVEAMRMARRGDIARSPGGLYRRDELLAMTKAMRARECQHLGCTNVVARINPRYIFCQDHLETGVSPAVLLRLIERNPGIQRASLYSRLHRQVTQVDPVLNNLIDMALVHSVQLSGRGGGTQYFIGPPELVPSEKAS